MKLTKLQHGLTKFVSPSRIRPHLAAVMTDGITAVATDSFRLVEITNLKPEAETPEPAILIDGKMLKQAKSKFGLEIVRENGKLFAVGSEGQFLIEELAPAHEYPKYQQIFAEADQRSYVEVKLHGSYLAEIAAHLAKFTYSGELVLKVPLKPNNPVILLASNGNESAKAILMPIRQ